MRWWSIAGLFVWTLGHAQPQPTRARAEERFQQGRQLMEAGKYAEACTAFEDSQQLDPAVTTLLNLGACREKRAELASAAAVFRAAERAARQENTAKSLELADIAATHVKRLEPRLSTLVIIVPREHRIDGLVVERSGVSIDPMQWDLPVPVDGGTYEIVVRAPKHAAWSKTITITNARDAKTIRVPKLEAGVDNQGVPSDTPQRGNNIAWPIALGIGALAATGGAWWFRGQGEETYERAKIEPDVDRQLDLWHDANRQRYIAQGLVVAGVGCAAVAVWLLVRGDDASSEPTVAVQPSAFGDGATVHVFGGF